jgi:large subunit ribosomal protein L4
VAGEEKLSLSVASPLLVVQTIRAFLANQRKARAKTKTRSEVVGSRKKVWRQKGTGRARHGTRQAPVFVGGGVSHGPSGNQNYHQKVNQKMAQKAWQSALATKAEAGKLFLVKDWGFDKTKEAFAAMEKVRESLKVKGRIAFILSDEDKLKRGLRNLAGVEILSANRPAPYLISRAESVFLTETALKKVNEQLAGKKEAGKKEK